MKISKTISALLLFVLPLTGAIAQRSANDGGSNPPPTNNNNNSNSDPYVNSKCYWTVDIDSEGNIGDKAESIIINKKKGSYAYCVVSNYPEVLNTDELIVDVYKKSGDEYKKVETKEYTLSSTTVKTTYFKYSFYEKGDYKFAVYNKNSKWINTAYLTVKYK